MVVGSSNNNLLSATTQNKNSKHAKNSFSSLSKIYNVENYSPENPKKGGEEANG